MAEAAVVSALIDTFIPMVVDKLFQEVSLIANFRKDFEFFCEQLVSIKCLLTDVGEKRNSSLVSNWLDSIEDFVADAEYLMEQCGAVDNIFAKLKFRLKMGRKIRELRVRLEQIQRNAKNIKLLASALDVNAHGQALDEDRTLRSYAVPPESEIVGMDNDIKVITEWILKENGPPVIAIVGMGGQGKTLLLKRILQLPEIRQHFDHQVLWEISQNINGEDLLCQLLRKVEPSKEEEELEKLKGNSMKLSKEKLEKLKRNSMKLSKEKLEKLKRNSMKLSKEELKLEILEKLKEKSCLFALDDVWNEDAWDKIGFLPREQDKVVLTTRHENIARALRADHILSKERLTEKNSFQLFCLHAFPKDAHQCPVELDEIAHKIVEKCGGLPLAIKTIGAYLARLVTGHLNDWEWTLHHLNEAHGMRNRVMASLKLSYQALPPHLKPCFLYCSVFPKNTEIESQYLVYAWIAQGFVSAKLEESYTVGRSYMDDLIDRCLIEVSEVGWDGRVQSCKMHDLLHDLAVSEQTKCLLKPGGQLKSIPVEKYQGLRRISLMKNEISTIENGIQSPGLRSLLLSHNDPLASISSSFFQKMRYLCVLDLSETSIKSLPVSIGNLRLLRYLNLSGTKIEELPVSIGNLRLLKYLNLSMTKIEELPESLSGLRHLQFLDVSDTCVKRLHSGIDKHKYMLHLNLDEIVHSCPVGISKLIYLHTLIGVTFSLGNAASANALQLGDLKELRDLEHLSLTFEKSNSSGDPQLKDEGTFRGMTKMRTLCVSYISYRGGLHLPTDMEAMERLEIVRLSSCVVPKWFFQRQTLVELTLKGPWNSSSADFIGLEKIPNLKKLNLEWNRKLIEFPDEFGESGAFLKLEELVICYFKQLKSIPSFHEDAMPRLRCLRMERCDRVENMPEGLMNLKNLKEVEVRMREDAVENNSDGKRRCWQSLVHRQIKIKVGVFPRNRVRVI